eukprot:205235-Pelagomonas_calceolata.AAC.4
MDHRPDMEPLQSTTSTSSFLGLGCLSSAAGCASLDELLGVQARRVALAAARLLPQKLLLCPAPAVPGVALLVAAPAAAPAAQLGSNAAGKKMRDPLSWLERCAGSAEG